jgi:hypothetical protein
MGRKKACKPSYPAMLVRLEQRAMSLSRTCVMSSFCHSSKATVRSVFFQVFPVTIVVIIVRTVCICCSTFSSLPTLLRAFGTNLTRSRRVLFSHFFGILQTSVRLFSTSEKRVDGNLNVSRSSAILWTSWRIKGILSTVSPISLGRMDDVFDMFNCSDNYINDAYNCSNGTTDPAWSQVVSVRCASVSLAALMYARGRAASRPRNKSLERTISSDQRRRSTCVARARGGAAPAVPT